MLANSRQTPTATAYYPPYVMWWVSFLIPTTYKGEALSLPLIVRYIPHRPYMTYKPYM